MASGGPKIGINGFGRVGRMVLRAARASGVRVVAINDFKLAAAEAAYFFKYDSTHGKYQGTVNTATGETTRQMFLVVDGIEIPYFSDSSVHRIEWGQLEVDYVIEATGKFDIAGFNALNKVRRVIVTAPSDSVSQYVYGVNHVKLANDAAHVISCSSCTNVALAPLLKLLHDTYTVIEGLVTTVHATTSEQKTVDSASAGGGIAHGRGNMQNIILTDTGANEIGNIIKEMRGKISSRALRVPVSNVSVLDLVVRLQKNTSLEAIKAKVVEVAGGEMRGVLSCCEDDDLVSSDFIGDSHASVFDAGASVALNSRFFKLFAWYDNEYGYACQILNLVKYLHSQVDINEG